MTYGKAPAAIRCKNGMVPSRHRLITAEPTQAHPAYWSPFVVVGEGAAAKYGDDSLGTPEKSGCWEKLTSART